MNNNYCAKMYVTTDGAKAEEVQIKATYQDNKNALSVMQTSGDQVVATVANREKPFKIVSGKCG